MIYFRILNSRRVFVCNNYYLVKISCLFSDGGIVMEGGGCPPVHTPGLGVGNSVCWLYTYTGRVPILSKIIRQFILNPNIQILLNITSQQ